MAITSPGISVKEVDLTGYNTESTGTTAALVGEFSWGPVESIRVLSTESDLATVFGYPTDDNYKDWLSARNYLQYSNSLAVVRAIESGSRNASNEFVNVTGKSKILIKNQEKFNVMAFGDGDKSYNAKIVAKYPGEYGNNIRVCVLNHAGKIQRDGYNEATKKKLPNLVDNSAYLPTKWNKNDIVVGVFVWDSSLAKWELKEYGVFSTDPDSTDANGYGNYVFDYFKNNSNYVYFIEGHWSKGVTNTVYQKSLKGEATTGASSKSFYRESTDSYDISDAIDIDVRLSGGYTQMSSWNEATSLSYVCTSTTGTSKVNSVFKYANFYDKKSKSIIVGKYVTTVVDDVESYSISVDSSNYVYAVKADLTVTSATSDDAEGNTITVTTIKDATSTHPSKTFYFADNEKYNSNNSIYLLYNDEACTDISFVSTALYYDSDSNNIKIGKLIETTEGDAVDNSVIVKFTPEASDAILRSSVNVTNMTTQKSVYVELENESDLDDSDTTEANNSIYYYQSVPVENDNKKACYLLFTDEAHNEVANYDLDAESSQIATAVWEVIDQEDLEDKLASGQDDTTPYTIKESYTIQSTDYDSDTNEITDYAKSEYLPTDAEKEDVSVGDVYTFNITNSKLTAYKRGWDMFDDEETQFAQVQLLIQGAGNVEIGQYIIDLANSRKDCLACVSPMESECVNSVDCYISEDSDDDFSNFDPVTRITTGSALKYQESSYVFMDGNYKYQYDTYNECYRWMPLNADMAGLFAWIDANEAGPWMSIGNRQVRDCVRLAFYPSKAERDTLWQFNVNPVTNFRAEGNVVWGDCTRISNTAFNFVGVRRCFLYMEREVKRIARTIMFAQNDEITATLFKDSVSSFLDLVQGGRGISEFGVYAGAEVTSTSDMDRGIFNAKILVKPIRSIRYIQLTFTAVRSDMSIEEAVVYD